MWRWSQRAYDRLADHLFAPVDVSSLVFFRIAFGLVMLYEVLAFFAHGWIDAQFVRPAFHFKYFGFGWVHAWPGFGMYLHFALLGMLAACIAAGAFYRLASAAFFFGFTYVFLIDQARYLNHFYLVCLVSGLMVFVPAARAFSLDARWAERRTGQRSWTVMPAWPLWLLRAQIGIVYFYGGIAKLNADWLRGAPMDMWLAKRAGRPLLGPLVSLDWMPYFFSYGGLLLDLLIVPLLLWRRTRVWAFALTIFFHLMNSWMFTIGIFPWMMIAATTLFFEPDWPRRTWAKMSAWLGARWTEQQASNATESSARFARGGLLPYGPRARACIVAALAVYLLAQTAIPLRHFLYPGQVHWNEEGHRFSWHMKLRTKIAEARFRVSYAGTDGERGSWEVVPTQYLRPWQVDKMAARPDMILQFAHFLADSMRDVGFQDVEVHADVMAALNGRAPRRLVDPSVDLAAEPRSLGHAHWVLPLEAPQTTASR